MQLIFLILIFFTGTALSTYYEKERFDRSVPNEFQTSDTSKSFIKKQWALADYETHFKAYKDKQGNNCYIEKLGSNTITEEFPEDRIQLLKEPSELLYLSNGSLKKVKVWRIIGNKIFDFCKGRQIILLENTILIPEQTKESFFNKLPLDENHIVRKREAGIVSKQQINRRKRRIVLVGRQKLKGNLRQSRLRRQVPQPLGRFRGQTQSQYLNIGNNEQKEGKAEAEATQHASRAVVSGTHGMGQAQSMSLGGGCEDCPKYGREDAPDRYIQLPPTAAIKPPGDATIHPSMITPGMATTYPYRVSDSTIGDRIPSTTGGGVIYPSGLPSSTYPGGISGIRHGGDTTYPKDIFSHTPGISTYYPGGVAGSTPSGAPYPKSISKIPGSGAIYPEGVPDTTSGAGRTYFGGIPGVVTYPQGIPKTTDTGMIYPGTVPGTLSGGVPYPGRVSGTATVNGVVYPGTIPGSIPGDIPSGVLEGVPGGIPSGVPGGIPSSVPGGIPGTVPGGIPGTVPGAIPGGIPGTVPGTVPGSIPGTVPGGIPGAVPGTVPGGIPGAIPGGIPSTTTGRGTVYPGSIITSTIDGRILYPGSVPSITTGGNIPYPGGTPSIIRDGGIAYPGGLVYPDSRQGLLASDKLGIYGSSIKPDTREPVRTIESKATADAKVYPNGQIPPTQIVTSGLYPPGRESDIKDIYRSPGTLPGTTTTDTRGVSHGGTLAPVDQLRGTVHYAGKVVPDTGTIPGISATYPGSTTYPGGTIPRTTGAFDHLHYPGIPIGPEGTSLQVGPDNLQKIGTGQPGISYPYGVAKYPDGSMIQIPEARKYPDSHRIIPSGYPVQGQYPGAIWHDRSVTSPGVPDESILKTVSGQRIEQYPSEINKQQYPPKVEQVPQYYQQPGDLLLTKDDNSNSQASSSVKQTDLGTQASASAQGKFGQGTAQSQVTGTYSGSGSFSAQAGSTDDNKSAQTEVNGGKEGAASNAQGVGGYGKSQAQVQLNSESGATTTDAQSNGWNHGTNSQVQASSKGGMADAQANGEGSTSSQAQIGFQPYLQTDEKIEKHSRPFRGGGTASAQSGTYAGQSQSQLEGSFQYGITYTGAAQAGSGSGAAASRRPFNFNLTDGELFKPFKPSYIPQITQKNSSGVLNTSSNTDYESDTQDKLQQGLQVSSSSRKRVVTKPTDENSQNIGSRSTQTGEKTEMDDRVYDYEEEYDDEYDTTAEQTLMNSKISKVYATDQNNSNYQTQTIHVATGNQYDVHVKQDTNTAQVGDVLQPGQSLSGYTIPYGFRGRVTSVAGDETIAHGNGKSQSQTVSLVSKEPSINYGNKSPALEVKSLKTNHDRLIESHILSKERQKINSSQNQKTSMESLKPTANVPMKPSYYTVTNSVAGKIDGRNSPRKYEHRYYTKSSTCGYFTFSCNVVYGSNGRTKICKPKLPTHPDGTPMKC
ncbi:uncharacterized protein LOC143430934 [Xylocopa sonorina]|uniref:uncharacterized protein LOC143430934 n=1 Tax=Xylocopa sonorina TaxID=1818115 RepID=UPI00403AAD1D